MDTYLVEFTVHAENLKEALVKAEQVVGGDCNVIPLPDNHNSPMPLSE